MQTIIIFGSSGMLGTYVETYFKKNGYNVVVMSRQDVTVDSLGLENRIRKIDCQSALIVNCVGVIKPLIELQGVAEVIRVNSLFPHILSAVAAKNGHKLIHITTDCVFSGQTGNYSEKSKHDATDLYGRSKSMGEPAECTVVRTSIIGEEKVHKRSLIEWAKSQSGKNVYGYLNHLWNGVTCLQLAKVIEGILQQDLFWPGVRHIYSNTTVSKFQLINMINQALCLNLNVEPFETTDNCYRHLTTDYPELLGKLKIPELEEQLAELKSFSI